MFTMDMCVYFLCKSLAAQVKLSEVRLKNCVSTCYTSIQLSSLLPVFLGFSLPSFSSNLNLLLILPIVFICLGNVFCFQLLADDNGVFSFNTCLAFPLPFPECLVVVQCLSYVQYKA